MAKYIVINKACFVPAESGLLRDRKKTYGAIVELEKADAAPYVDAGQLEPVKVPRVKKPKSEPETMESLMGIDDPEAEPE